MSRRRIFVGLTHDFKTDKDENRRDDRPRDETDKKRKQSDHGADADQQSGQQCVPPGRAHLFVCRMADIGRGLRHAAEESRDQ